MADVTVTPGRSGPVEVLVQLYDGDEKPLQVDPIQSGQEHRPVDRVGRVNRRRQASPDLPLKLLS